MAKRCLKLVKEYSLQIVSGSDFHNFTAQYLKEYRPYVVVAGFGNDSISVPLRL